MSPFPARERKSDEYLRKLEGITLRLCSAFPDAPPMDREDVARLVMELQQGHDETLGAHSPAPRPMMKLPASHWRDFAPAGALFAILRRCLQHKHENHLRRFDWQSDKKRAEFVGVMRACAEDLHRRGMRRIACVALAEGEFASPEAARRVREAAAATGAVLAVSPSDEGVTHVLHAARAEGARAPAGPGGGGATAGDAADLKSASPSSFENAGCVILGVTASRKEALVRYVRHPESYEQTVSLAAAAAAAAPGAAAEASAPPPERDDDRDRDHLCLGSWWGVHGVEPAHVFAEWLTDSAAFNEWCEEEDYLWEDPAAAATRAAREATRAREAEARRAASFGTLPGVGLAEEQADDDDAYPKSKKARREKTAGAGGEVLAPSRFAERVAPDVTRRMVVTPHRVVFAACAGDFGDGPAAVLAAAGDAGDGIPGIPALPGTPAARGVPVIENISRGQRTAARAAAAAVAAAVDDAAAPPREDAEDAELGTASDDSKGTAFGTSGAHALPGYAAWFRKDATHEIEKIGVPEFFGEDAAEDAESRYRALRDATMSSFAPGSFLRFDGALRRAMATAAPGANIAAATQQRVYDFCNRWGLINWQADEDEKDEKEKDDAEKAETPSSARAPAGTNAAAADALYRFDPAPANGAAAVAAAVAAARELEARAAGIREITAPRVGRPPKNRDPPPMSSADGGLLGDGLPADGLPAAARVSGPPASRRCRGCAASLVGTGRAYYRAETAVGQVPAVTRNDPEQPELDVTCVACFAAGNLPDGASSARFARVVSATRGDVGDVATSRSALAAEPSGAPGTLHARDAHAEPDADDADANDWTDQETLTLLEAIERHGEDWSSVASRVATKNAEQCVRRFARLPIEDAFVERLLDGGWDGRKAVSTPNSDGASVVETPFAGAPNPVMSVVAFLATCVGPRVAAAAAKAALAHLAEAADPAFGLNDGDGAAGAEAADGEPALGPAPAVTREQAVAASAAGMAAAAVHAKLLADRDEHEIEKLAVGVVEMQMRKIELKLRQMEDLDAGLARERAAVDRMFAAIAAERAREEKTRKEAEARAKAAEEEEARRRDAEAAAAKAAAEAAAAAEAERREIAAMLAAAPPAPAP
jgi:SWI/SNF related-matrix-associated actin-dependent regulator of chromatin subfamily C